MLRKPPVLPAEPVLSLARTGRHEDPSEDADDGSRDRLEEEASCWASGSARASQGHRWEDGRTHSQRQPAQPLMPRIWRIPDARREPTMLHVLSSRDVSLTALGETGCSAGFT
jgi:hypothetical protein